ncbi:Superoxide dismutase [Mn], mitochondrial [Capsicum annuum]|uniref:superoxide dismutase n=1 Tax=Capsicum annuum TaxID=4072 RepID=A0A2G2Y6A0_CAPAN|nr:Superoxide dismutase [Mn], mitochondrial [Capsicum annuum]
MMVVRKICESCVGGGNDDGSERGGNGSDGDGGGGGDGGGRIEIFISIALTYILPNHVDMIAIDQRKDPPETRTTGGGEPPKGSLGYAINTNFDSLEAVIQRMNAEGVALQGFGWVWLGLDKELKCLVIETTANQDPLVIKGPNLVPLLGIDVCEHAYYLQYKNVKPDYLKNIWKVMN